jgi:hypothetical protein
MPAATSKALRSAFKLPFTWRGFAELVRSYFGRVDTEALLVELRFVLDRPEPAPRKPAPPAAQSAELDPTAP